MSPLRYGLKSDTPPNLCLECGVQCRRPKRFCSEDHKETWLSRKIARAYPPPVRCFSQLPGEAPRIESRQSTESREWRQKLALSRPF